MLERAPTDLLIYTTTTTDIKEGGKLYNKLSLIVRLAPQNWSVLLTTYEREKEIDRPSTPKQAYFFIIPRRSILRRRAPQPLCLLGLFSRFVREPELVFKRSSSGFECDADQESSG